MVFGFGTIVLLEFVIYYFYLLFKQEGGLMSTSYESVHGIGYELSLSEEFIEKVNNDECDSLFDYLFFLFKDCQVGVYKNSGNCYCEEPEEFKHYLFIENPFENGFDGLIEKIESLQNYVIVNDVSVTDVGLGVFGDVGVC